MRSMGEEDLRFSQGPASDVAMRSHAMLRYVRARCRFFWRIREVAEIELSATWTRRSGIFGRIRPRITPFESMMVVRLRTNRRNPECDNHAETRPRPPKREGKQALGMKMKRSAALTPRAIGIHSVVPSHRPNAALRVRP